MSTVIAPQYRRGTSALHEAQERRDQARKEIAQKQQEEGRNQQTLVVARHERMVCVEKAVQTIAALLSEEKYRDAQQAALDEIHRLLGELKMFADEQDRFWIAKKVLHLTSWRGMKALNDVEEVFGLVFKDNVPDEIAEGLARLIDKQTKFLRERAKENGTRHPGKTAKDHKNGSWKQRLVNVASKAEANRQHAKGGHGDSDGQKKKKK